MAKGICSVDGCERVVDARQLCKMHYTRLRKYGTPGEAAPRRANPLTDDDHCAAPGCFRRRAPGRKGLCYSHFSRFRLNQDLGLPFRFRKKCGVDGCTRPHSGLGWCQLHYTRWKKYGSPDLPQTNRREGTAKRGGYWGITRDGKSIPEHRWVMQQALGRPLLRDETVHHLNGVRDDNRLENLELWSSFQPAGQRVEDKIAWAKEILARYGVDFLQPRLWEV